MCGVSGTFNSGVTCESLDDCYTPPEPVGACCTGTECLSDVETGVCARLGGAFYEYLACGEISCGDDSGGTDACFHDDGRCFDAATESECAPHGTPYPGETCEEIDFCGFTPEPAA